MATKTVQHGLPLLLMVIFASLSVLAGQAAATLELRISSGGKPTVARVYITDGNGQPHRVPGGIIYWRRGETHSVVAEAAAVALPPGRYTVRAEKGAEFRPVEKTVELAPGRPARLDLDVPRFYNMNERGWYSGDLHIHRGVDEMPLLARAEDLNVAPVITRHVGGRRPAPPPFPTTNLAPVDDLHFVSVQNQEVERLGAGHGAVILLNTPQPVDPEMSDLFPMDLEFCRQARRQGGFIDAEKPIWKNVPVNVAFGAIDAIGVVNNHFHPRDVLLDAEKYGSMERDKPAYKTVPGFARWMLDLYYSFLNCGFKIPVSAGSASGVMPSWPGYERVYVHMSGPFSYDQWFRDLQAGRSVATNGPLLEVYLDGNPPGSEIAWEKPARAKLAIDVHSQGRLDSVEIVFNGAVIRTFSEIGKDVFKKTVDLDISEAGWLAVRCFETLTSTVRYAHSSPFYFPQNGKLPVKRSDALRWAEYIRGLAASADAALYPSRQDYEKAQGTLKEAESIYRRLAR